MKFTRNELFFLIGIAVITILLRLPMLSYGLPTFVGADDDFVVVPALEIASFHQPATHFGLPDSTLFYTDAVALRVVFEVLKPFGVIQGIDPLDDYVHYAATWPLITVRVLNIIWVLLGLFLIYTCTRRLFEKRTAMIATTLLAFSWIVLEHSLHARPDVPSMVFVLLVLWSALNVREFGRRKDYIWAGIWIGLSIATKYPLALTSLMILAAHLSHQLQPPRSFNLLARLFRKNLWIAAGVSVLTFSIATPLFWPLLPRAIEQITWESRSVHTGADGLSFWGNLTFYLTHVLNYGIGTFASIVAIGGAGWIIAKQRRDAILLLVFPVALIIALSFHGLHWDRWMIPVLPFIAMFAAHGIHQMIFRASSIRTSMLITAFVVILLAPTFIRTIRVVNSVTRPETREQSQAWMEQYAMENSLINRGPYTPFFNITNVEETKVKSIALLNEEQYEEKHIDYLVSNVDQRERFLNDPGTMEVFRIYYRNNLKNSDLIHRAESPMDRQLEQQTEISDWDLWQRFWVLETFRGPIIEIYAFSKASKTHHGD